ncbi:MAG: hypothetical protein UU77_C0016G0014 [candidate division WWE3 bacterium GW2011_GWC1_41_7]|uniref:FemAB family protein n=3 Tax=Katanobacteria TaxID=422282 RepID=A0A0G0ZFI2_UNCKA|nr:MAG: hypothetical protein UU72_C0016G0002 [candidate division WWE3 bacterium GW2011_GWB1_41_6]KKS20801.1 MAG: hypothetical protein UU77_C0016G0014 [candidate division WWE3 bacterium GW2011_GWC1_41_7]
MKIKIGGLVKVQHPKPLTSGDLEEIEKIALENNAMFVKIEPHISQDISLLESAGYIISLSPLSPPSTIYINLALDEKNLLKKISKSGRYSIRRAGKEGAEVKFYPNPDPEILEKFYELMRRSAKKQGFSVQSFEDLKKKAEVFGEECTVVLGYDSRGELTGGKFFLTYEKAVWYVHAGTTELGRKLDAGHKMMWESLVRFKNLGYTVMDMDGIDDDRFPIFTKKWGGFSYFKEKFGGEVIRFPYPYIKYHSKFLKFLAKYRMLPL